MSVEGNIKLLVENSGIDDKESRETMSHTKEDWMESAQKFRKLPALDDKYEGV